MLANVGRPFTSDAVHSHGHPASAEHMAQDAASAAFRAATAVNSPRFLAAGRSSSEFSPRYLEGPSPTLRGYSPQMSSRGFGDDPARLPAQKKSRLNLLNPMSLLARRRTSQNQVETSELTINTMHVPAMPENFNPSIRGTITHDFSAPRSRRTPSHSDVAQMEKFRTELGPQSASTDVFAPSPNLHPSNNHPPNHSPMFREHFQDDRPALRPEQTAYLHHAAGQVSLNSRQLEQNMPAFAKRLPQRVPDQQFQDRNSQPGPSRWDRPMPEAPISPPPPTPPPKNTPPLPPPQPQQKPPVPPEPEQRPPSPPQDESPPTPPLNIPPPNKLPKHMTSTSSRFSFQIGGQASSTQEKLLEEKHKQFQANKRVSSLSHGHGADEDFDDYDFDADAGMEEEIPEFNVDDYDGHDGFEDDMTFDRSKIENSTSMQRHDMRQLWPAEEVDHDDDDAITFDRSKIEIPSSTQRPAMQPMWQPQEHDGFDEEEIPFDRTKIENMTSTRNAASQGFHFTPDSMTFSPTSSNAMSQPTPRDESGLAIGVADTKDSPNKLHGQPEPRSSQSMDETTQYFGGLGIATTDAVLQKSPSRAKKESVHFDDEDLYFDDGEFADNVAETDDHEPFNEEMLDDETTVRDIPAENLRRYESAKTKAGYDGKVELLQRASGNSNMQDKPIFEEPNRHRGSSMSVVTGLTEDNLAAYHTMLANAANEAAANGKFNRVSFSQDSEDESQPGIISDESRLSNNFGASGIAYDDGFPFDDDDMDDEMMIAAANAEALENDDDGFYGQEFGFYARARNKDESDMINGGFFAPRGSGSNGVKRSHSGRANFQEPSLTPITERSEWSTRNSVASLQIPGGIPQSANSLPSPGIAQLLERDSPIHDDDMTLSALMKLRRGAFGGSSSSVSSLTGNPHNTVSSPLAQYYPHPFSPQYDKPHNRMSSSIHSMPASSDIPESEEEGDYLGIDEPTLTQNTPMKKPLEPHRPTSPTEGYGRAMSPTLGMTSAGSKRSNHSRASSGAESVSYTREMDGRWVLERRRTGEDGVPEVDREYLAGARI